MGTILPYIVEHAIHVWNHQAVMEFHGIQSAKLVQLTSFYGLWMCLIRTC
jgi:hypothetical protein